MSIVVDSEEIKTHKRLKVISQLAPIREKIRQFEKKYGYSLTDFAKKLENHEEKFDLWDDYIEWKAYVAKERNLEQRLREIDDAKDIRIVGNK